MSWGVCGEINTIWMDNYVTRKRSGPSNTLLTQTAATDYEKLCKLDVLGLPDKPSADQSDVNKEFKEQLTRSLTGWYETGLC